MKNNHRTGDTTVWGAKRNTKKALNLLPRRQRRCGNVITVYAHSYKKQRAVQQNHK